MGTEGVYFFHIPKTAGVSVWRFLEQSFPADQICPWWLWDQLIDVPRPELDRWQVFRGHFQSHLEPYLGRPLKTFTFLRDPVARTISQYFHVRRAPEHPYHSHALRMSLSEFCLHPETRHMVENYQAAYLAKSPLDLAAAKEDLGPLTLQQRTEYPDYVPDTTELLVRAQERLSGFVAIGITENFDESLLKISKCLPTPEPTFMERWNANPEGTSAQDIDEKTLALIRDLTDVDRTLYRSALSGSLTKVSVSSNNTGSSRNQMISYAQNFEDVILQRVFRNQKEGFYIDVGAMDPVFDSVTKAFYDRGWSGINIEPNEWFCDRLRGLRPRDINLNLAVGEREENRPFYVFEQYGNSTFGESHRDRFAAEGHEVKVKVVKVTTLEAICERYATRPIDFLKIDCEGWEKMALEGADWERFRPTVVIVEATEPGTTVPAWAEWQPILEGARYEMVYFDGLNRFYLSQDHDQLRCRFGPPNPFDDYKLGVTVAAEQKGQALQQERDHLQRERDNLQLQRDNLQKERNSLQQERDHLTARIAELETKLETKTLEVAQFAEELQSVRARVAELDQDVLKARLWIGQLSQELAASKRRPRD